MRLIHNYDRIYFNWVCPMADDEDCECGWDTMTTMQEWIDNGVPICDCGLDMEFFYGYVDDTATNPDAVKDKKRKL